MFPFNYLFRLMQQSKQWSFYSLDVEVQINNTILFIKFVSAKMRTCWTTLMSKSICINEIKRRTHRTQHWSDTNYIKSYLAMRPNENSRAWVQFVVCMWLGAENRNTKQKQIESFIMKLDLVRNVNLLKCVQWFFFRFISLQALIQHVYSFHLLHSILVVVRAVRCGWTQSAHSPITIDNFRTKRQTHRTNNQKPSNEIMWIIQMVIQSMSIICFCNLCAHLCN